MTTFFYDSYAVIEYINANPKFVDYFEKHTGIITLFNLVEIYYITLAAFGKSQADIVFETIYPLVVEPSKEELVAAMVFRKRMKGLSYADCVGYAVAQARKIKFLTGDKEFKGLPNVAFVQK